MNLPEISPGLILDIAQTVAVVVLWLRKPGEDAGTAVKVLEGRVDVHEERLKHMSSTSEMGELDGDVKAISATLEAMQMTLATTQRAVERLEAFLRENR